MSEIDFDGPDPIYRQLADVLKRRIADGTYQPNRRVPSEAALCAEFDVSRNTVRAALRILADLGMVRPVVGRGVFVISPDAETGRTP
jgi:GntR family transcriptional regulator